jgi:hypothetical protein
MQETKTYPDLVDVVWEAIKDLQEGPEPGDPFLSEQEIAQELDIPYDWSGNAIVFGISQAITDLVKLGYCKGIASTDGERQSLFSVSPDHLDALPSAILLKPPLRRLPPLQARLLKYLHESTVCQEMGIIFYHQDVKILFGDAVSALLPDQDDIPAAVDLVVGAARDLQGRGFIRGQMTMGAFNFWVTLKGACWLLVAQPLLALRERAIKLSAYPEAVQAIDTLINAYSESEKESARELQIAVEQLENAAGGERPLASLLEVPKTYIGDLKQSLQMHRHAATQAQQKLNHGQCLERATEIIKQYIARREEASSEQA